jgi:hypothetical protein
VSRGHLGLPYSDIATKNPARRNKSLDLDRVSVKLRCQHLEMRNAENDGSGLNVNF